MGLDIAQILTIGGPGSIVGVILYVSIKALMDLRKERREDQVTGITTETGIIDNTRRVMELVRSETDRLEKKNVQLERDIEAVRSQAQACEDEAARQKRRADGLAEDVQRLEKRIIELEGRLRDATSSTT